MNEPTLTLSVAAAALPEIFLTGAICLVLLVDVRTAAAEGATTLGG